MMTNPFSKLNLSFALICAAFVASTANAQCCGTATTTYYQPGAYTAYSPVAYTTYRTGWYPGYFLDRIRARLWGTPATYTAGYPSTYVASYPSAYVASYPTYTSSYSTSYSPAAVSACTSCVSTQQVTMRPVACCDPCAGGTYSVSQTSYEQPPCNCGNVDYSGQRGAVNGTSQPEIDPAYNVPARRTETERQPLENNSKDAEEPLEAEPSTDNGEGTEGVEGSRALLEAPELFNPNDRTARHSIAPVRHALYTQPVSQRQISALTVRITAEQAARDAAGWRSTSK